MHVYSSSVLAVAEHISGKKTKRPGRNTLWRKRINLPINLPWSPGKGRETLYSYSKLDHVSNTQLIIGMISQ